MNEPVSEAWVLYIPVDGVPLPVHTGRTKRETRRKALNSRGYMTLSPFIYRSWVRLKQKAGWRCLRVIPMEVQS